MQEFYRWCDAVTRQRALGAMGDAEEVGRGMDKAHKPWLGWLWLASKILVVVCLAVTFLYGGYNYRVITNDLNWSEEQTNYETDGYFSDPENPRVTRVAVMEGGSAESAGYTFSIPLCGTSEK